jgi:hypothetical protein
MKTTKQLHDKAMKYCTLAKIAVFNDKKRKAKRLYKKALPYELLAADSIPIDLKNEPSRSILYRSAASIAMNCGIYEVAKKAIECGMAGFPPREIEEELINLGVQVQNKLEGKDGIQ